MVEKGKKYIWFLLCLIVIASLCGSAMAAAVPDISVSDAEGKPGDKITVSLELSDNPGLVSMALDIEYDSSVLRLTEIIDTGLLPGKMHTAVASSPYRLTWANDTARQNYTVNGIVVNLVFEITENAEPGNYPVRVICPKNGIIDYNIKSVTFQLSDGEVVVEADTQESAPTTSTPDIPESETKPESESKPETESKPAAEAHKHTMVHIQRTEASCYREGNVEYWLCTSCSKKYADENGAAEAGDIVIPSDPDRHSEETYILDAKKATKKREGYTGDTYCLDCNALLKTGKVLPALEEDASEEEEKPEKEETVFEQEDVTDISADGTWNNPFKDIRSSDSCYDAIRYVYENGLFKGVSATEFAPSVTMTRAMFVTVLGRMDGVDIRYFAGNSFTDVVPGEWYAEYVEWAATYGIVQGYGNGIFGINDPITVEQAAVILARYAAYIGVSTASTGTLNSFADAGDVSGWAVENMKWVVESGIYAGEADKLNPQTPASRALVAVMLYNFQSKNG